tara:strand:- start:167 stop:502 length:336 start_codon:yes stop_codon:yes gene_type:complete
MARTNVVIHKALRICTTQLASEGLSDRLFNAGVRIEEHCLNLTEALNYINCKVDASFEAYALEEFLEQVFASEDGGDGVRTTQWVGYKAPFGETTDKGLTPQMQHDRRKWI